MDESPPDKPFPLRLVAAGLLLLILAGAGLWFGPSRPAPVEHRPPHEWDAATREEVAKIRYAVEHYLTAGELPKARAILEKFLPAYPADPQGPYLMARLLIAENRKDLALTQLQASLKLDGRQPDVFFETAVLFHEMGRRTEADGFYRQAVTLSPDTARYRLYHAQNLLDAGKIDEALSELVAAQKLDASLPQVYALQAEIAFRAGHETLALEQMDRAIALTKPDAPLYAAFYCQKAQIYRRQGRGQEAVSLLLALPVEQQRRPSVIRELAACYQALGRPDKAAVLWMERVNDEPLDVEAAAEAGLCFLLAGDRSEARRFYTLARNLNPAAPGTLQLKAALSGSLEPPPDAPPGRSDGSIQRP